jgi:multidrug efflux pump subunit AcrA (membrane-fusion protein)
VAVLRAALAAETARANKAEARIAAANVPVSGGNPFNLVYGLPMSPADGREAKLAAETARADKAEARAKAAEALLTPEQKAKLGK